MISYTCGAIFVCDVVADFFLFLLKGLSTQGGRRGRFVCRVGVYEERHCFKVLVCLSVSSFVEGKSVSIEIILQLI